jgi:hypothetical protein
MMTNYKQGNMLKYINLTLIYSYRTINYNESHTQCPCIITYKTAGAHNFIVHMGLNTIWGIGLNENVRPNNQFFTLQLHLVIGEMKLHQNILSRI